MAKRKKTTKRKTTKKKSSGSNPGVATSSPTSTTKKARKSPTNKRPAKKKTSGVRAASATEPAKPGFPIVGIGASAGGLEALEELLDNMPTDTGMAFVVVTHQHPGHTSLLPELLGKETEMPVAEAVDGTTLAPNHVYVGPPGGHLAILNGTLHRMETDKETAPRLPIDYFFRSLAEDQQERAICIVLSGTGTDGTLGLKAIKGESGMAMVQQSQSAKYAGMPSSAEGTGLADYVLPPAAMPKQLVAYASGPYLRSRIHQNSANRMWSSRRIAVFTRPSACGRSWFREHGCVNWATVPGTSPNFVNCWMRSCRRIQRSTILRWTTSSPRLAAKYSC
jgi:two-component system CheB/CheR fusion protein